MDVINPGEREQLAKLNLDLEAPRISEIVLKTARFEEMKAWYQGVLGVAPLYENRPRVAPGRHGNACLVDR